MRIILKLITAILIQDIEGNAEIHGLKSTNSFEAFISACLKEAKKIFLHTKAKRSPTTDNVKLHLSSLFLMWVNSRSNAFSKLFYKFHEPGLLVCYCLKKKKW